MGWQNRVLARWVAAMPMSPQELRDRAEKLRLLGEQIKDGTAKTLMLELANEYERTADAIERASKLLKGQGA